jgi:hypothetical protein
MRQEETEQACLHFTTRSSLASTCTYMYALYIELYANIGYAVHRRPGIVVSCSKIRRLLASLHLQKDLCLESTKKCCRSMEPSFATGWKDVLRQLPQGCPRATSVFLTSYLSEYEAGLTTVLPKNTKDSHAERQIHNYISSWCSQTWRQDLLHQLPTGVEAHRWRPFEMDRYVQRNTTVWKFSVVERRSTEVCQNL